MASKKVAKYLSFCAVAGLLVAGSAMGQTCAISATLGGAATGLGILSSTTIPNSYTISGSGQGVVVPPGFLPNSQYNKAVTQVTGDFDIRGTLLALPHTGASQTSGLFVRGSGNPAGDVGVAALKLHWDAVNSQYVISFEFDKFLGGRYSTQTLYSNSLGAPPLGLRMTRVGTTYTAYADTGGMGNWLQLASSAYVPGAIGNPTNIGLYAYDNGGGPPTPPLTVAQWINVSFNGSYPTLTDSDVGSVPFPGSGRISTDTVMEDPNAHQQLTPFIANPGNCTPSQLATLQTQLANLQAYITVQEGFGTGNFAFDLLGPFSKTTAPIACVPSCNPTLAASPLIFDIGDFHGTNTVNQPLDEVANGTVFLTYNGGVVWSQQTIHQSIPWDHIP